VEPPEEGLAVQALEEIEEEAKAVTEVVTKVVINTLHSLEIFHSKLQKMQLKL
jgi:hypothetical protein